MQTFSKRAANLASLFILTASLAACGDGESDMPLGATVANETATTMSETPADPAVEAPADAVAAPIVSEPMPAEPIAPVQTTPPVTVVVPATQNFSLSWDPPTANADGSTLTDLNGYRILYGLQPGVYNNSVTVSAGLTRYTLENLQAGTRYYVVMIATNRAGAESQKSQEVFVDMT